jgi:tRNA-Thr(GGU) m(6)t(6)A37 methyltransferase TsaA
MNMSLEFKSIAVVHSPFKEKFGIPRQPGLVKEAVCMIQMLPPFSDPRAFVGIEEYSHLWISFVFHGVEQSGWRPMVRPPRLGGNRKVGVFATRSTHRPNPIGLSVVELLEVRIENNVVFLHVAGADFLDGTPVLDIKPYVSYVDSVPAARSGFAPDRPDTLPVVFDATVAGLVEDGGRLFEQRRLIEGVLAQDPRPAYHAGDKPDRVYGVRLEDYDVRFSVDGDMIRVHEIIFQETDD